MRHRQVPHAMVAVETAKAVREALKPWPSRALIGFVGGLFIGGMLGVAAGLLSRQRSAQIRPSVPYTYGLGVQDTKFVISTT